ncbi:hypothetical protein GGU11DRAFT_268529 [Lentinula aff. detonsa]|uniref:Uncharacterized protein n=1 Tax=Lentinula aff. detonsa TaxID=2804958 RepID=A0AA38KY30_9AGAR|nr:hypothetical protein GGU10DRAFT_389501 [Lentinula aff. detonsa]KAJ3794885.1 hypothetical protein GGU11DRAFT_268529 [Lentinula aff. detonsa]
MRNILRSISIPYFALALALALASTPIVLGNPVIWLPKDGATVTAGSEVTVMVQDTAYATPIKETSLSIGMSPCSDTSCPSPDSYMLYLLYTGAFDPQRPSSPVNYDPGSYAFQNFSITVPAEASGNYTLGALHAFWSESAVPAYYPTTDVVSITVNVVPASN